MDNPSKQPKTKQRQVILRMDEELHQAVKEKCKKMGIGVAPIIKLFLRAFVTQKGVGFYVGDEDLCNLINIWLSKKRLEKDYKGSNAAPLPGPQLKDLYWLNRKLRYERRP